MKFTKKEKPYKTCPRCGNRCLKEQSTCEECGLMFSRMEFATNSAAKKQLRHFDRDFIIYTSQLPKDVKKWKLVLYAVFLGLVGGHYYYVGKYWKGLYMSVMFIGLLISTYFNEQILNVENLSVLVYLPIGIYALVWCVSLVFVISNKFKVPVLAELPKGEEVDAMRADFEKVSQDLKKEQEKLKEKEARKTQKDEQKDEVEEEKIHKKNKKKQNGQHGDDVEE